MVNRATNPGGNIKSLGKRVTKFQKLETFPKPPGVESVELTSDEVTANCPVTNQPDYYTVTVSYQPDKLCVESKTAKLFFQSYRNLGLFCEAFACEIAQVFADALDVAVNCTVVQKSRGGVSITAKARRIPKHGK